MKSEITRDKIRTAFISQYMEHSVERISIQMICDKAGISRSTFYRYYDDIYEVLEEAGDKILDRFLKIKAQYHARNFSDTEQYMRDLLRCIRENEDFFSCVLLKERSGTFLYRWKQIIRQDLSDKYARNREYGDAISLKQELVVYGAIGMYSYWLSCRNSDLEDMIVEALVNLWDRGKI